MILRILVTMTLAVTGAAVAAAPVGASEAVCEISLHDHTPGQYPGGLHLHNTCD